MSNRDEVCFLFVPAFGFESIFPNDFSELRCFTGRQAVTPRNACLAALGISFTLLCPPDVRRNVGDKSVEPLLSSDSGLLGGVIKRGDWLFLTM